MYDLPKSEVNDDFVRCWQAAGQHLHHMGQGGINSWIRAHLEPPFLEHISFRLGNQLFFIRLEDVDGVLDTPASMVGLLSIADGCSGHACVMPMKKVAGQWKPQLSDWGLLEARTRQALNPVSLITDELIEMTDWEFQDFAVQVVRDQLESDGRKVISWANQPGINPSIWFVGDDGPEWVVVRGVRYPQLDAPLPENITEIANSCARISRKGNFAVVGAASMNQDFSESAKITQLYRGHGMYTNYKGLRPLK